MNTSPNDKSSKNPAGNADRTDDPPTPSEVLAIVLHWLRHYWDAPRHKAKWTEGATVILTLFIAAAAIWSAWIFQGQLDVTIKNFTQDERAWIEIEPIKPTLLSPPDAKFPATFICNIYPKNVGKTVARDIVVKSESPTTSGEEFGQNAEWMRNMQDKMLLGGFKESGTDKPVIVPNSPVPKVLAPNAVSPVHSAPSAQPRRCSATEPKTLVT